MSSGSQVSRTSFIKHQGRTILLFDFSGITDPQEAFAAIEEVRAVVAAQPKGSLLTLTDVSGASFSPQVFEAMRDLAIHNRPHVKAAAVIAATGVLRVSLSMIAQFSGRTFGTFAEIEKAKDWLIQQAGTGRPDTAPW